MALACAGSWKNVNMDVDSTGPMCRGQSTTEKAVVVNKPQNLNISIPGLAVAVLILYRIAGSFRGVTFSLIQFSADAIVTGLLLVGDGFGWIKCSRTTKILPLEITHCSIYFCSWRGFEEELAWYCNSGTNLV